MSVTLSVDPRDMLNNLFSCSSKVTYVMCQMSIVKCLCGSLGHAEHCSVNNIFILMSIGENGNPVFLYCIHVTQAQRDHGAGSQLKTHIKLDTPREMIKMFSISCSPSVDS